MARRRIRTALLTGAAVLVLGSPACGAEEEVVAPSSSAPSSSAPPRSAPATGGAPTAAEPSGTGCTAVVGDEDRIAAMAGLPVVTAVSTTPELSTLVRLVVEATVVDELNSARDVTVLAPANQAFEAVAPEVLAAVLADDARSTALLGHHVLEGRLAPGELAGTHTTLAGGQVTIAGSGADATVAGTLSGTPAAVVCGGVRTANAAVYVVDQVLAPPAD